MKKIIPKKMNKKATLFGWLLVIVTIILIGSTIASFNSIKNKLSLEVESSSKINELNSLNGNYAIYLNRSSSLALQQAYFDTISNIKQSASASCQESDGKIILSSFCGIEKENIEKEFLKNFNREYLTFALNYPFQDEILSPSSEFESLLSEGILIISHKQKEISTKEKIETQFFNYTYTLKSSPEFIYDLEKEKIYLAEIVEISDKLKLLPSSCKNWEEQQAKKECISSIQSNNFEISFLEEDKFIRFILSSKDKFVYFDFNSGEKMKYEYISFTFLLPKE